MRGASPSSVRIGFAVLIGLSLSACSLPRSSESSAERDRVLRGLSPAVQVAERPALQWDLAGRRQHYRVPGLGMAVIRDGRIAWTHYEGVLEEGGSSPVGPETRFMAKSLAKPVTAFAALRLVEQGTLSLDAPLQTWLRSWTIPPNPHTERVQPTLRHLLSHSAGFTVRGVPSYRPGDPLPTLVQALDAAPPATDSPVRIDYEPGTRARYSGGGYSVLQLLLEDVTGEPFPELMARLALDPVGMERSLFTVDIPEEIQATTAVGHDSAGKPLEGRWEVLVQMAAGGLVTTPEDTARFVVELMRAWQGRSPLISQATAREMMTAGKGGWGLGLEVAGQGDGLHVSHTGSGDGFRAILVGFPERGDGAVVLVNGDSGGELRHEILRSLAREYGWPAFGSVERAAIPVDPAAVREWTGTYTFSDGSTIDVSLDDGRVFARWKDLLPVEVFPASDTLFFNLSNEEYVFSREGEAPTLTWRGSFGEFTATRRP